MILTFRVIAEGFFIAADHQVRILIQPADYGSGSENEYKKHPAIMRGKRELIILCFLLRNARYLTPDIKPIPIMY